MKQSGGLRLCIIAMLICTGAQAQENNQAFEVTISGKGNKDIIFIPGFACSGQVWDETKARFEKDFTCYVLTMAGFAGVPPQAGATFENWEKSIAAYIKQNNLSRPVIIGHSMGGALAMALAADYPELVGKIVVVDALPCLQALSNPSFKSIANNDCAPVITQIRSMNEEQFVNMQHMSIGRLLADSSLKQKIVNWSVQSDRETFAAMYCDFFNTDLRGKIARIQCPNLVMLEAYFAVMKPQITEQFKVWKNARLEYATKGLHFIMFDDKDWYFDQLKNFMHQ